MLQNALPPDSQSSQTLPAARKGRSLNPLTWLGELSESRYWAYLLLLPSLLLVVAVIVYPVFYGVYLSFQQFNLFRAGLGMKFVGLQQYT